MQNIPAVDFFFIGKADSYRISASLSGGPGSHSCIIKLIEPIELDIEVVITSEKSKLLRYEWN